MSAAPETIAALLASPLRVRVTTTDDPTETGECTLGDYARDVFGVFGDEGPDDDTLDALVRIAGSPGEAVEVGPDTVTMLVP